MNMNGLKQIMIEIEAEWDIPIAVNESDAQDDIITAHIQPSCGATFSVNEWGKNSSNDIKRLIKYRLLRELFEYKEYINQKWKDMYNEICN